MDETLMKPNFQINSLLYDLAIFSLDVSGHVRKELGIEGFWSEGAQRNIRDLLSSTTPPSDTDPMDGYGKWGDKPEHLAHLNLRLVAATSMEWLACFESWRRHREEFRYYPGRWLLQCTTNGATPESDISEDVAKARAMLIELWSTIRTAVKSYGLKVQELTPNYNPDYSTLLPEPSAWDHFAISTFVSQMSTTESGAAACDYAPPVDERFENVGNDLSSIMRLYAFFHNWNRITSSATPAQIMAMQSALDNPEGYWRDDTWCPNSIQMTTLVTNAITTHAALCAQLKARAFL